MPIKSPTVRRKRSGPEGFYTAETLDLISLESVNGIAICRS
jgi:hypothetical protein